MRIGLAAVVVCLCLAPAWAAESAPASAPTGDEQLIRDHFKQLDAAWDAHDAKAVAALFASDGDIITESGMPLTGRDGIEAALSDGFANSLQNSKLADTVQTIRFIKPDVAIVDADTTLTNGDAEPQKLHVFSVLMKQHGKWMTETTRAMTYKDQ